VFNRSKKTKALSIGILLLAVLTLGFIGWDRIYRVEITLISDRWYYENMYIGVTQVTHGESVELLKAIEAVRKIDWHKDEKLAGKTWGMFQVLANTMLRNDWRKSRSLRLLPSDAPPYRFTKARVLRGWYLLYRDDPFEGFYVDLVDIQDSQRIEFKLENWVYEPHVIPWDTRSRTVD
jgi:hypothetical protein